MNSNKELIKELNKLMPKEKLINQLYTLDVSKNVLFEIEYITLEEEKTIMINILGTEGIKEIIKFINNEDIGIKAIRRLY